MGIHSNLAECTNQWPSSMLLSANMHENALTVFKMFTKLNGTSTVPVE